MAYDKHIDKTEEELCELREVYSSNEVECFTDGLESGRINCEEKVIEFTNYIRNSDGLTQLEYSRLKRLLDEGFTDLAKPSGRRMEACARGIVYASVRSCSVGESREAPVGLLSTALDAF